MPEKKSLRQFGMRTLLILVAVAAVISFLGSNEMIHEDRREKLTAELEANGTTWTSFDPDFPQVTGPPPRLWPQWIGAWLRGKPMVQPKYGVWFAEGTSPAQIREFLDLFPHVRIVALEGSDATKEVLQRFASHGPIDELRFKNSLVIDKETARLISQIKCQRSIEFTAQEWSDDALQNLADVGVKVQLSFGDVNFWRNVGDEGLKAAAKLQGTYAHASCLGTDQGLRALAEHPSLSKLYVTGPNYTDASADVIPSLPRLSWVHFSGTGHTDAGLAKAVSGCKAVKIELFNVSVGDQTIAALAQTPRLMYLNFRGTDLSAEQCDALAKLPLTSLEIHSENLSDDEVSRLAPLAKTLHMLVLNAPQVTDDGLSWLSRATSLMSLRLYNTQATTATWSSLPSVARVRTVGTSGVNFNAEFVACAAGLGSVNVFCLSGSEIDDAKLELLPPSINAVSLFDTQVTSDGLKKLAQGNSVRFISVFRDSEAGSRLTAEDVKEALAVAKPGVQITYEESSIFRCE